jgi:hypothetical protein
MKENELRIGNSIGVKGNKDAFTVSGISQYFNDSPYDLCLKCKDGMFIDISVEDVRVVGEARMFKN